MATLDITPSVISTSPVDNAMAVLLGENLLINFNATIQKGTGNILIKKLTDNSIVETIDVLSSSITVNGNQLTINPKADFTSNTGYYVEIANTAIQDLAGNSFTGITGNSTWNFQSVDAIAPTILSISPLDNATTVLLGENLVVNFSEMVQKGLGDILIKQLSDNSVVETINVTSPNVTVNGSQVTINPIADFTSNTGYYVEITNSAIRDMAGNSFAGMTGNSLWNFQTVDNISPTLVSLNPIDNATTVTTSQNLVVNFSETVKKGIGNIRIKKLADNSLVENIDVTASNITVSGTQLTINPTANLLANTAYYVEITNGAITDTVGNNFAGILDNSTWNFQTADTIAPTVVSTSPVDNATIVAQGANLIVNFSEPVQKGSGNIVIKKLTDGSVAETIAVTASNITVNGTQLTINPTADLLANTNYYVEISNGAIKDQAGNNFAGITGNSTWNFQTADTIGPSLVSVSPVDNALAVPLGADLLVNFNEPIQTGTGNILIKNLANNSLVETIDVTTSTRVNGNQLIINPINDLTANTAYYIQIANDAVQDLVGNYFAGINANSTWNFQTADTIAPTVVNINPVDNGQNVSISQNLVVNFSEPVQKGIGNILIKKLDDHSIVENIAITATNMTVSGSQLTINPANNLLPNTAYYVEIANGAIKDLSSNNFAGMIGDSTWNFQTADTIAPTVVDINPVDNATAVAPNANLVINFSEPVRKGTGNILIKKIADNSIVETINVTDTKVTINENQLTINPTNNLGSNTGYYIEIANSAIKDFDGNSFAGMTGNSVWNFQTADVVAPQLVRLSPLDNGVNVPLGANLVVNFNEPIQKGSGNITIKNVADGSTVETIAVTQPNIATNGSQLTINPVADFTSNMGYYIEIARGAIQDTNRNNFAGITGNTRWNFRTVDTLAPVIVSTNPMDDMTGVFLNQNLSVRFDETIQKGMGNILIKKLADNSIVENIDVTAPNITVSGSQLTINPTANLTLDTGYYVEIANGAIKDTVGNYFTGISNNSIWNFRTIVTQPTTGPDVLLGKIGDDTINGLAGNDTISGLAGNDRLIGGDGDDSVLGNAGSDTLVGNTGNDLLNGGDGADYLNGSGGIDTLLGAGGNDIFLVNPGNDRLTGGTGADKFTYDTKATFTKTAVGIDTITDFLISQNDKIVLDKTTFPRITSANGTGFSINAEFAKVTSDAAAAVSGADIVYNTATGALFYNQNGTASGFGTGGKFAVLTNKPNLTENQFIIQA
jgi:methionine-rich copper-binding protein CopC